MRHTCKILALLLCFTIFLTACRQETKNDMTDSTTSQTTVDVSTSQTSAITTTAAETESPYDENGFLKDDLPDDLDLGNKTIYVFIGDYSNAYIDDMYAETQTGDRLKDTVYTTIKTVEDDLNVNLKYNWETYAWADMSAFQQRILTRITSGDKEMDLLFDSSNFVYRQLEGDYFLNLADTKYIDLEKPWYNRSIIDNMPSDYVHFVLGDFALANVKNTYATYFNAELYRSLGKNENLYEIVENGEWTLEKMETVIADCYFDLNGNGTADIADQYGLCFGDTNKYLGFLPALNVKIFTRTADGYEFTYGNEHAINVADALIALVNKNENVIKGQANGDGAKYPDWMISSGGGNYVSRVFTEGRAVFTNSLVADASTIVGSISFEYGLLPYPKWDKAQENYQTTLQRSCSALISSTTTDVDAASAVLEAIASVSYRLLLPEYCEVMLKTRYAQDSDVSRMFDLIAHSVVIDLGEIYNDGGPAGYIRHAINAKLNWASHIASNKSALVTKMDEIFAKANEKPAA